MRRKWTILLVVLFAAVAVAAERVSAYYVSRLAARRRALETELEEASLRTLRAQKEKQRYDEVERLADKVAAALRWEPDSTNLLRWFADLAAAERVRLVNTKLRPLEPKQALVADDALRRTVFEVTVEGRFASLVRFLQRIEHSPHVMIVERLTLAAQQDSPGTAELKLTVSCLSPAPKEEDGQAAKGEGPS